MFTFLKNLFTNRYGFPKYKKDIWYNQSVYCSDIYPIIFDANKRYIKPEENLLAEMGVTNCGKKVFYKIIKIYKTRGSDWLYDYDNINCNMVFSHVSE